MTRYAVVIEKTAHNYSAYIPDVPGCVATGKTVGEVVRQMEKALQFHIEGMHPDEVLAAPTTDVASVEVDTSRKGFAHAAQGA